MKRFERFLSTLNFNSSGGDEGFDETFAFDSAYSPTPERVTLDGYFNAYGNEAGQYWDHLILTTDSGQIWNTGCVRGVHENTFTLPAGSTFLRIQVLPNCNVASSGTAWTFNITTT